LYAYCRNNPITKFDPDGRQDADYLADALAAQHLGNNTDISDKEYYQVIDRGKGIGALAGAAVITACFVPEIIAALGPTAEKYNDKLAPAIKFSKHALERLAGRESHVTDKMIKKTIELGQKFFDPKNKTINYILKKGFASGKDLLVGTNPISGQITTVISGRNLISTRLIPIK
jgi:hypothetical protein